MNDVRTDQCLAVSMISVRVQATLRTRSWCEGHAVGAAIKTPIQPRNRVKQHTCLLMKRWRSAASLNARSHVTHLLLSFASSRM